MIADNLKTRGIVKPLGCQFCAEEETISHLFFDCVVAKEVWRYAAIHCNLHVQSYFDMARKWICDLKKKTWCAQHHLCRSVLDDLANSK